MKKKKFPLTDNPFLNIFLAMAKNDIDSNKRDTFSIKIAEEFELRKNTIETEWRKIDKPQPPKRLKDKND